MGVLTLTIGSKIKKKCVGYFYCSWVGLVFTCQLFHVHCSWILFTACSLVLDKQIYKLNSLRMGKKQGWIYMTSCVSCGTWDTYPQTSCHEFIAAGIGCSYIFILAIYCIDRKESCLGFLRTVLILLSLIMPDIAYKSEHMCIILSTICLKLATY